MVLPLLGNAKLALSSVNSLTYSQIFTFIDWFCNQNRDIYQLRAIPLMSVVTYEHEIGNPTIQQHFLDKLKAALPNKKVTIVTDAGFRAP